MLKNGAHACPSERSVHPGAGSQVKPAKPLPSKWIGFRPPPISSAAWQKSVCSDTSSAVTGRNAAQRCQAARSVFQLPDTAENRRPCSSSLRKLCFVGDQGGDTARIHGAWGVAVCQPSISRECRGGRKLCIGGKIGAWPHPGAAVSRGGRSAGGITGNRFTGLS